ncbi:tail fiber assembly protein [Yersinia alsatica]|uniref:tail fiber assembly protein n=1 Tax=Yersinia alsatica TaxID=2890317 RepID=UPI00119E222C|nr:tail fiber assembly protein [Yersinia alsatica]
MTIQFDKDGYATSTGTVIVHNAMPDTREYIGSSDELINTGQGLPARAYLDSPPSPKKGFVICRTSDQSAWEYVADHRGEIRYSTVTGDSFAVSQIGNYPDDSTDKAPTTPFDKWDGKRWVADADAVASIARKYRNALIMATDSLMLSDYCIGDTLLTAAQQTELLAIRSSYRAWPTQENWPLIELPELPQWLLIEAVNQGYIVPTWPPEI